MAGSNPPLVHLSALLGRARNRAPRLLPKSAVGAAVRLIGLDPDDVLYSKLISVLALTRRVRANLSYLLKHHRVVKIGDR